MFVPISPIQGEAHEVLQSDRTQTIDHILKCFRKKFQCSRRPLYSTILFFIGGGAEATSVEAGGMNISPDCVAEAQLATCRSTHKHAMRLFSPVWTQSHLKKCS